ncbi:hypothetical protein CAPTEDRAFT_187166 [Capitella teleta]|uniref:Urease accessory protein UreF n=1 Tax=Capitella teleta TaxID=283909 RepID=R7UNX1_CAPTE|nr:hypothetical protein CAPTEDRAFT_187166 [Capitella teleta]|eukprot:ELU05056.1 hypothetical protein CAPTEDRAFT_187166 [Capitella teleta]
METNSGETQMLTIMQMCDSDNTATKMVPFVREAHESADLMDAIIELDEHCQTCLTNHVENRASRRQGRALLDTSIETFIDVTMLRDLKVLVEDDRLLGHLPVVFGVVCASLQVGQKSTCLMFMYNSLRTMIASSVRLGFAGTLQAQGIQHEIQQLIPEIVDRHRSISVGEVHVSFPSVDVLQNLHDTMFSKLFYS